MTLWRYESDTITSSEIRVEQSAEISREAPVSVLVRDEKKYELTKSCKSGDYVRIESQKVVQCKSLAVLAGDSVGSSWLLAILLCFLGLAWMLYEYEYIQERNGRTDNE